MQSQEQSKQVHSPASNPTSVPLTKDEDKPKPHPTEVERPKEFNVDENRTPEEREKLELLKKIGEIVKDYGGLEANIPLTHEYWNLLNQFRYKKY
jgi:hypothetical protein